MFTSTASYQACSLCRFPKLCDWQLEKAVATHSSIPVWRIAWTEEPGGPQAMGSQKSQTRLTHELQVHLSRDSTQPWLFSLQVLSPSQYVQDPSTYHLYCCRCGPNSHCLSPGFLNWPCYWFPCFCLTSLPQQEELTLHLEAIYLINMYQLDICSV